MDDYKKLVAQALENVEEIFPWDLEELLENSSKQSSNKENSPILLDIREKEEFDFMHIDGSISVPRGVLEGACCWNYADTVPELVEARDKEIIVICKSGNRSALAGLTMQMMGYKNIKSLKMGIKGWNDNDNQTIDKNGNEMDIDKADEWLNTPVPNENLQP
jgi:rhodanese-related sulfurtransferase